MRRIKTVAVSPSSRDNKPMSLTTRRAFLNSTLAVAAGAASAAAIEPIRRVGPTRMRLSLAAYSFRDVLQLRQGRQQMTLDQFIIQASAWPLDAVELTGYYFPQTTPEYLAQLKGHCTRQGLDISGSAVGNNFCVTDAERLRREITSVKQWIEHTARLGGKTLRIFAGTVERNDTEERARGRAVEAIQECCTHAGQFGVYLALENHGGITSTPAQLLALVRAVRSDWFGVNLDTGNFHTADPYADLAQIAPYAVVVQMKTEIRRAGAQTENADLRRLFGILRNVNYRGYVALEYEAAADPRTAVPAALREMRELCG
jgi:sugar phosphate isomerase/epimerase